MLDLNGLNGLESRRNNKKVKSDVRSRSPYDHKRSLPTAPAVPSPGVGLDPPDVIFHALFFAAVLALIGSQLLSFGFQVLALIRELMTNFMTLVLSAAVLAFIGVQLLSFDFLVEYLRSMQAVSLDTTATAITNTTNTASSWSDSATSTRPPWPSCQPSFVNLDEIRHIYFIHTRKAGGSYIRRLLNRVAQRYNWTVWAREGTVYLPELEPEQLRRDTLYVTNLRHPVHRAISDYKYEGRWDCGQLVDNKTLFVPTPENAQSLHDYIEHTRTRNSRYCGQKDRLLWQCTELCYLGWFGGAIPYCVPPSELSQLYNTALERLSRFNLVIITEWLKDPNYRKGLFEMFGFFNVPTNLRHGMYCGTESKYWNSQYPAILPNDTLRQLYDNNKWDVKLYETVTRNCSSESVVFPAAPMTAGGR